MGADPICQLGLRRYRSQNDGLSIIARFRHQSKRRRWYGQFLGVCRQAAVNRQVTSAQRAQLETITGSVEGLAGGAGFGLEIASQLKGFGLPDVDIGEVAGYGALAGLIGGLATSFSSGTSDTADETRDALLSCINATSNNGSLWQLLE